MERAKLVLVFATLALAASSAQDRPKPATGSSEQSNVAFASAHVNDSGMGKRGANSSTTSAATEPQHQSESLGVTGKFRYYLGETYLLPGFLTAPAFRASIRMANPPGHFPNAYPADWRQGAEGIGRNYGDAMAQRITFQTARFATNTLIREDPRYAPSSSHNVFVRSLHAFTHTFADRSD